ncbi:xylulose kinase [Eurytemora carolleeae]|uniref:xylulose kinase n=1 Tax=Eurytemora carolleeae TaxID=1294199 RepID=UPI000C75B27C|nr:xylulose kinase [Eurytemora carolleeae]|eukprot:XP_023332716.1 xylulose kinase-like [Eurytemora affinis]
MYRVYTMSGVNSAAAGGAYRALHLYKGGTEKIPYSEVVQDITEAQILAAEPNRDAESVYRPLIARYRELEKTIVQKFNNLSYSST